MTVVINGRAVEATPEIQAILTGIAKTVPGFVAERDIESLLTASGWVKPVRPETKRPESRWIMAARAVIAFWKRMAR